MTEQYAAIYLSPHLDDAALSCGGQIYLHTAEHRLVLVVTLMAGDPKEGQIFSPFAQSLHRRWALPQAATAARRREDEEACQILGADYLHWPVPEAVYRLDPATVQPCYPTWEAIISRQHPADTAVLATLTDKLRRLPAADHIFVPLTAGNHVDHRLTRQAAEAVFGGNLRYYEDYPYAADGEAVAAVLGSGQMAWQATTIPLTEAAVRRKARAIWAYSSQMSTFFTSRADLDARLVRYTAQVGGERLWQKT